MSTIGFNGVIDGFKILCLVASIVLPSLGKAQAPVFVVTPDDGSIKFFVKASVAIGGTFDKWDATLAFTSPDVTTAVLDVKIQADSVNTGSGMKDGKLKGKDFFDVKQSPLITFLSKKVVQTGPDTFDVLGDFTIRGVTKPEKLTLALSGKGTGTGNIKGTLGCMLMGPAGFFEMSEGVIRALRHVHMSPDDADYYGVKAGDEMRLKIGGPCGLSLDKMLVRTDRNFKLEVHIDTDEGNACNLQPDTLCEVLK